MTTVTRAVPIPRRRKSGRLSPTIGPLPGGMPTSRRRGRSYGGTQQGAPRHLWVRRPSPTTPGRATPECP
jgi:hypothetical protein